MATNPSGPPFRLKSRADQDKRGRRISRAGKNETATVSAPAPPPIPDVESVEFRDEKKALGKCEEQRPPEISLARRGFSIEQKRFVVESFACFQGVSDIAAEFRKRWGYAPDYRQVARYDPRRDTCTMGQALRTLFDETRKRYVTDVASVAIAHQAHRLRLVSRVVEKATNSKDYAAALKGLELAAKEMGGALTAQHVVRHEGTVGHVHATVEEARRELAARLSTVVAGGLLLSVATPTVEVDDTPQSPSVGGPP